jgi:hypothetical protein
LEVVRHRESKEPNTVLPIVSDESLGIDLHNESPFTAAGIGPVFLSVFTIVEVITTLTRKGGVRRGAGSAGAPARAAKNASPCINRKELVCS